MNSMMTMQDRVCVEGLECMPRKKGNIYVGECRKISSEWDHVWLCVCVAMCGNACV